MSMYVNELEILKQNLPNHEFELLKKIMNGNDDLINHEQLLEKLVRIYTVGVFAGSMPYTVQKAETQTPDEWLSNRLSKLF